MSGPVEFLCAKLDEIEARAKAAEAVGYFIDSVYSMGDRYLLDPDIEINKRFVEDWDPATVLRMVASTRQLLELHERWERPKFELVGNYVERVENGPTIRHWPPGSITGQRQVGVYYECGHCMHPDESQMAWPCPTITAIARGWGWTDE